MALLGKLFSGAAITQPFVNLEMQYIAATETRQRAIDRSQRTDPSIEHEYCTATKADDPRCDLVDQGLEDGRRQAAAAGIFDKGRIESVGHRRPDERIDATRHSRSKPLGLNAVGIQRQMESVLLGTGAERQNGGSAVLDAARGLVPSQAFNKVQAFDEIAVGIPAHADGP
jgi:hypothetical protein